MRPLLFVAATLLSATAHAQETPICTDRPTKANAVCTVATGDVQLESSVAVWSQLKSGGTTTSTWSIMSSLAKVGLDRQSDLQVGFTPYVRIRSDGSTTAGPGDVVVRYKRRLTDPEGAVQVGIIPLVKLPTARRGISNRKVEGGVALPISTTIGDTLTLTLGPEVDLLADGDGRGYHPTVVNLVSLAAPVAPQLTLIAELWSNLNFDPAGTVRQASADVAAAYLVSDDVQLDIGANAGLTDDTADIELLAGVSLRF